jgi:hypothetical protein
MENMANSDERPLWFKARRYGWGWTPASAEGWIVTIIVGVSLIAGNYLIARLGRPPGEIHALDDLMPRLPASAVIVAVIVWNALVLIPTLWICWKTGERPRWRWGDRGGSIPPDRGASS